MSLEYLAVTKNKEVFNKTQKPKDSYGDISKGNRSQIKVSPTVTAVNHLSNNVNKVVLKYNPNY